MELIILDGVGGEGLKERREEKSGPRTSLAFKGWWFLLFFPPIQSWSFIPVQEQDGVLGSVTPEAHFQREPFKE